jgi:predicted DNA-binding protein (UPF0251 family)
VARARRPKTSSSTPTRGCFPARDSFEATTTSGISCALRNTFISQRRAAVRRPRKADLEFEALALPDLRTGTFDPSTAKETREVYAAITALPPDYRDEVVAIDVTGLSYAEAARMLGVREGTVTSRLHGARSRVAASLSPERGRGAQTCGPSLANPMTSVQRATSASLSTGCTVNSPPSRSMRHSAKP